MVTFDNDLLETKNNYDFWSALSPTYRMYKWIGLAQFNVDGPAGNRNFILISLCSTYKISLYVFITCLAFLIIVLNEVVLSSPINNTLIKYITIYQGNSIIILIFSVVISNAKLQKKMMACLKEMIHTDKSLSQCEILVDNKHVKNVFILWNFFYLLVIIFSFIYVIVWQWKDTAICLTNLLYIMVNLYKLIIGVLYKNWIFCIKQRLEALNEKLRSNNAQQGNWDYIRKIAQAYYHLSLTVQALNSSSLIPTLMCVTVNSSVFIIQSYHLYTVFCHGGIFISASVVFLVFWMVVYGTDIGTLILLGGALKKHVSAKKRYFTILYNNGNSCLFLKVIIVRQKLIVVFKQK